MGTQFKEIWEGWGSQFLIGFLELINTVSFIANVDWYLVSGEHQELQKENVSAYTTISGGLPLLRSQDMFITGLTDKRKAGFLHT